MATQTLTAEMTDEQFELHALKVLSQQLDLADYARYLRLCRSGSGDYTRDRDKWQTGMTVEQIVADSKMLARLK